MMVIMIGIDGDGGDEDVRMENGVMRSKLL